MKSWYKLLLPVLVLGSAVTGYILIESSDQPSLGPCIHREKAVLEITSVNNADTGKEIQNPLMNTSSEQIPRPVQKQIKIGKNNLPSPGNYSLNITAEGYQRKQINVKIPVTSRKGGCPSFEKGEKKISISLEPK
jgi:hypothetical protein